MHGGMWERCDSPYERRFIKGGDPNCAEGVKYDFRLSSTILKAIFGRAIDTSKLSETEKGDPCVTPFP